MAFKEEYYKGLVWKEKMIRFFANKVGFSRKADTPIKAYVELAKQTKERFSHLNPYFERIGDSFIIWIRIWDQVATATGDIILKPSQESDSSTPKGTPYTKPAYNKQCSENIFGRGAVKIISHPRERQAHGSDFQ